MKITVKIIQSPLGKLLAGASNKGVSMLHFMKDTSLEVLKQELTDKYKIVLKGGNNEHLKMLEKQLKEYFNKERKEFELYFDFIGTDFQKEVWDFLLSIPYGKTITYMQQAKLMRNPETVRAVASANAANKIPIVVPCHRVIGKNGKLTGYSGGLKVKEYLLQLENGISGNLFGAA